MLLRLLLPLLLALSDTALAEVKGLPFSPRFASAAFPYARTVTGCTEWRRPGSAGDHWGPVSFAGACQLHDQCYHTLGASWGECNQRFLSDLRAACDRDLKRDALARGKTGDVDAQALQLCYEIASTYFAKVQEPTVARRFEFAQKMEAEYLEHVRTVLTGVYASSLGRKPTSQELEKALLMLQQDYGLDDLKAALMGAKLDGTARVSAESE